MFITNGREERKLFTYNERKQILKHTGGICACCGKKLTTKTMTIEHIIPIIIGGTNDTENLTALCPECNKMKGGLFVLPFGFYHAIVGTSEMNRIENYAIKWFKEHGQEFDIERYPMISPITNVYLNPTRSPIPYKHCKNGITKQLILQWHLAFKTDEKYADKSFYQDLYSEIKAVTNVDTWQFKNMLENADYENPGKAGIYVLKKLSNDKLMALAGIRYCKKTKNMKIYIPWMDINTKSVKQFVIYDLVKYMIHTIEDIAGYDINTYEIITPIRDAISRFIDYSYMPEKMGYSYDYEYVENEHNDGENLHKLQVNRIGMHLFRNEIREELQQAAN